MSSFLRFILIETNPSIYPDLHEAPDSRLLYDSLDTKIGKFKCPNLNRFLNQTFNGRCLRSFAL